MSERKNNANTNEKERTMKMATIQSDKQLAKASILDGAPLLEIRDQDGRYIIFRLKPEQAQKLGEALIAAAKATK